MTAYNTTFSLLDGYDDYETFEHEEGAYANEV
jgi:hypothetical protein